MTDVNLDQIEARAKAAFPGSWDAYSIPADPQGKHGDYSAVAIGDYEMRVPPVNASFLTADHIAGMSPDVVLALVARVRAAEAERDELRAAVERVEALADEWEQMGGSGPATPVGLSEKMAGRIYGARITLASNVRQLREALAGDQP